MNFQIFNAYLDGSTLPLSSYTTSNENTFTMLVGKNATGKTRALGKIVNSCLFTGHDSIDFDGVSYEGLESSGRASQVIAVSNSRFDRFPEPSAFRVRSRPRSAAYHYLGLSNPTRFGSNILAKCAAAFVKAHKDTTLRSDLRHILDYVGFLPAVQLEFRRPFERANRRHHVMDVEAATMEVMRAADMNPKFPEWENQFDLQLPARLEFVGNQIRDLTFALDLNSLMLRDDDFSKFADAAGPLLAVGIIELKNITFYDQITKDKVPFRQASSGQQCMLRMFLGLASVLEDSSLVCMDEPEISLHPRWQSEFIKILQHLSSSYHGCHFIIASHSPQIVAGLSSINNFVVDMESREIHDAAIYSKKSADFQLAEVFEEPGFKNEYLIRILLGYLSSLAKGGTLSEQDLRTLSHIESIKSRLAENRTSC